MKKGVKHMKKQQTKKKTNASAWIVATILAVLVVGMTGCQSQTQSTENIVRVGVMLPQTGLSTLLGKQMLQGIKLAANETTDPFELVIEDDQCDPKQGVNAAKKLIETDNVAAILGPLCITVVVPTAQIIEDAKIPALTIGKVTQAVANAGDYHFSFLPELTNEFAVMARYAKAHSYQKMGAIMVNDYLGRDGFAEFQKALDKEEVQIVAVEYFEKSETDFRSPLAKIAAQKPDAIYMFGYSPNMIALAKQYSELNLQPQLLSWSLWQDNAVLPLGAIAEKVVYSYPEDSRDLPVKAAFKKKFKAMHGEEPSIYAANAYDSYNLLHAATTACGQDRECIKSKLYAVKDYEGANGFITVDDRGVTQRSQTAIKQVAHGTFTTLE